MITAGREPINELNSAQGRPQAKSREKVSTRHKSVKCGEEKRVAATG